jgi:hypothetical protein
MNEQDRKFKEIWELRQQKGRWHYGLVHGSVFGFAVFVILNLFKLKDQSLTEVYFSLSGLSQMAQMVGAGIVGYSTLKWWMNQSIYKKIIHREKYGDTMD